MSSPARVTIDNRTATALTTHVTRNYWVEGDGASIDGKSIPAHSQQAFDISAKTGHHGELDIQLLETGSRRLIATLDIKSIKDPQDGHGLQPRSDIDGLQITAVGHRSSPGASDLRRIEVTLLDASTARLPYNQVSMKASHNSYQRDESLIDQIRWDNTTPYNSGCGAVELDISQSSDGKAWSVGHDASYHEHYRQLSGFLADLTAWARETPGHDVITLHLDLKHTATANFPAELDAYLRDRLPEGSVYSPAALMGTAPTLAKGAEANGWPTLEALRNRFIICITGDGDDKKTYAETDPKARLCFADKDIDADGTPSDAHRVFFNIHILHASRDKWMKTFRDNAGKPQVITRAYEANSEDNWNDCLNSGCNLIATNKIRGHAWAMVGTQRFARKVPLV
ncbi:Ca2+-dependent phosphoinositide-specific phospholipase C [Stenotrophomonas sp.]|uniref:Ca2+-dependent phosphoinositide-specific phospholipase C n=1 Tax=Stenotrophomonas sp. TaxID=69392 RepID=UPI002FC6CC1A